MHIISNIQIMRYNAGAVIQEKFILMSYSHASAKQQVKKPIHGGVWVGERDRGFKWVWLNANPLEIDDIHLHK